MFSWSRATESYDWGQTMLSFLKEFFRFMRMRKRYWLAPVVVMLLLLGVLVVFAEGSAVAPFVYTLF